MKAPRPFYLLLALSCASLLGFGYYLQFAGSVEPCPLCIFQRVAYISVIIIAGAGFVHAPEKIGQRVYSGLITVAALVGAGIASRQVWLQHLPADKVPECGPGLDYLLEVFSFAETLQKVFTGSGECAEVQWTFLGFSIPEWSLLCFTLLATLSVLHIIRGRINSRL